jgi:hypothetical protein
MQEHQTYDGQVAGGAETGPETLHFIRREGHDVVFRYPHSQPAHRLPWASQAHRSPPQESLMKTASDLTRTKGLSEPSTQSNPGKVIQACISSALLTIRGNSQRHSARELSRVTTSFTGWQVKRCGVLTQKARRAWTGPFSTTGARPTSTATTPCLRRGCDLTNRCLCQFTTQCRWATCKTG